MKRFLVLLSTGVFVFVVMACGGLSNEEACNKVSSLCSSAGGDAGARASVKVTCNPDNFDKMSNDSDVKECIDKASDCTGAVSCMAKAKPE